MVANLNVFLKEIVRTEGAKAVNLRAPFSPLLYLNNSELTIPLQ